MKHSVDSYKKPVNKFKKNTLAIIILCFVLLNGCNSKSNESANVKTTPTITADPTITSAATISPSITPSLSVTESPSDSSNENTVDDGLLTEEDAQFLIEERLDTTLYTVSLLSDNVTVDNVDYYSFVVKKKNVAIEPALVVNKVSGQVSCFKSNGTISDYSEFPLYDASKDAICDWNGEFKRYNSEQETSGIITLAQGDPNSFEFTITINSKDMNELSGIGRISGNTATYTDGNGFTLSFVMLENVLKIKEEGKNSYLPENENFTGTYELKTDISSSINPISEEDALDLLTTLTKDQTSLPSDITDYKIISDETEITVKNKSCYSFGVYTDLGKRLERMNSYYVAVDGSKIFMLDIIKNEYVEIYSAK